MCKPISLVSTQDAVFFFDADAREAENPRNFQWDSHASICEAFGLREDMVLKWEFTAGILRQDTEGSEDTASAEDTDRAQRCVDKWTAAQLGRMLLAVVKQNGHVVHHLTDAQRTPAVCLAVVKQDGFAVQHLTDTQRTPAVCLAAVKQYGPAVHHLTDAQRTPAVCLAAVKQDGHAVQYLTAQRKRAGL